MEGGQAFRRQPARCSAVGSVGPIETDANGNKTKGGKQVEMKAVNAKDGMASQFEATDDALKADALKGRVVVTIKDKKYNIDLKDDHK